MSNKLNEDKIIPAEVIPLETLTKIVPLEIWTIEASVTQHRVRLLTTVSALVNPTTVKQLTNKDNFEDFELAFDKFTKELVLRELLKDITLNDLSLSNIVTTAILAKHRFN